jgi:hypothetical protein
MVQACVMSLKKVFIKEFHIVKGCADDTGGSLFCQTMIETPSAASGLFTGSSVFAS